MHVTTTAADTGPLTVVDAVSSAGEVEPSLRGRALRASAWLLASKPLGMSIQLVRSLVLTRLLFPEAFGLMALVGVVIQGLVMCSDVGIQPNIIQSRRGTDATFLQTAWTLQILRGFILWSICCVLAWPAAAFYDEPALLALLPVAGLNVLINGFHSTAGAGHVRQMYWGRLTVLGLIGQLLTLIVMVLAALWLRNVWALVIGGLTGSLISVTNGFLFLPGVRHRLRWDIAAVRDVVAFGKWIFVSTLLLFFAMQMDKIVLGKLIPIEILGVYSIALVLANLPRDLLQTISSAVLFPAVSAKCRDRLRPAHKTVKEARNPLLQVGLLLCLGVAFFAPAFFRLYDPRYGAAAWMAQLLALSAWATVLNASTASILLAFGDSKSLALGNLVNVIVTLAAALGGFRLCGLPGFIIGYAVGTLAGEVVQGIWVRKYGVRVLRMDGLNTVAGLVLFAAYLGITEALDLLSLGSGVWAATATGLALYGGVLSVILPALKRDLLPSIRLSNLRRLQRNDPKTSTPCPAAPRSDI